MNNLRENIVMEVVSRFFIYNKAKLFAVGKKKFKNDNIRVNIVAKSKVSSLKLTLLRRLQPWSIFK